ncbi:T9SS type A sorting domain-containing protein [Dyadobacter sp. CY347]|uniref:T9SS type A sorting domain-containing protein n=1 Tax=Dyadobacter sp. CY347 TaxID=2909336 RepID=UPI001F455E12|nr:T9SS type A sorting domain-containing protein [Dyadobacter sp. CY347]MCF2491489.1 T9SS type A sorting domain-containing protein [Dyadobacter sp. CY347]
MTAKISYLFYSTTVYTILCVFSATAQPFEPGVTYFGANNYIEYRAGNLPIILTAPHGGKLIPLSIPDRNCIGCNYISDANTDDLAIKMDMALRSSMGGYPHIIINHLHRKKMDANREIVEAADGNLEAEAAWKEWEAFILAAKADIVKQTGKGLLIDIHGHGHDNQRIEVGFDLSGNELRLSDATLVSTLYRDKTSIKYNIINNLTGKNTPEMIRGEFALGTLLAARGYPSVPSQQDVAPLDGEPYFEGGYNIERYGSTDGSTIDAIQIECNMTNVRDSPKNRTAFAAKSADALKAYMLKHYGDLNSLPVTITRFIGEHKDSVNYLTWQTADEINNKGFQIERLGLKSKWQVLGFVNANGEASTYDFTDNQPLHMSYYRLRQIDIDGKETFSRVIFVSSKKKYRLKLYPSVTSDFLTLETTSTDNFLIVNLLGQTVSTGKTTRQIDVSSLSQGIYIIRIGREQTKFVKL